MNVMRRAAVAIAVVVASTTGATAQTPEPFPPSTLQIGQRVRVFSSAEPRPVIGGVGAIDDQSITVVPEGWFPIQLATREIISIDTSRGRRRNWLKGLAVGLAVGTAIGFAFKVEPADCGPETVNFCSRGEALAAGAIVFGGIGAGVGAFITSERWAPIDLPGRK